MPDKYRNFAALANNEADSTFSISIRNMGTPIAIVAPHGGEIEPGTSEIALAIARDDYSYYLFEGLKTTGNGQLHITSSNFDEPQCLKLIQSTNIVITIHGEKGDDEAVYLGGLHNNALSLLRTELSNSDFVIRKHPNHDLQGLNKYNICNKGRSGAGIQLELSKGLRRSFFESFDSNGRNKPTNRLTHFANCLRVTLKELNG